MGLDTTWRVWDKAYFLHRGKRAGIVEITHINEVTDSIRTSNLYMVKAGTTITNSDALNPAREAPLYIVGARFPALYHELMPIRRDV
jgi:hypothetical protein